MLLVLVVVALITLGSFNFFDTMFNHRRGAENHGQHFQAMALCESGLEYLLDFLSFEPQEIEDAGGFFHNPARFQGILVVDDLDPRYRGRFTIIAPTIHDPYTQTGVRYGLEDESARLNLNILPAADERGEGAAREILMYLPGMTESIADAILDWIDADDQPREFGAELDYYSALPEPYAPTNGPLQTVEQLLLVKGVTPELLFGVDVARTGLSTAASIAGVDNGDGALDRGWSGLLTLYSAENNLREDGTPKIDINMEDLEELHTQLLEFLDDDQANFIIAYRQGGAYEGEELGQPAGAVPLNFAEEGRVTLQTVLDVVGVSTSVVPTGSSDATVIEPAFPDAPSEMTDFLPLLMDNLTTLDQEEIPGRLNINQAPRSLLLGVPGLEVQAVDEIVASRVYEVTPERPERRHETWILSEGIVTVEEMKSLMPFVNAGGDVYRAQIVGYYDEEGPTARLEAIVHAISTPRVWFLRDLSHLGRGYPLDALGVELEEE